MFPTKTLFCHDSPQQLLQHHAQLTSYFLKIQARRHPRKTCVEAGHPTCLLPPVSSCTGMSLRLSALAGLDDESPPHPPYGLVPSGSSLFLGEEGDLQVREANSGPASQEKTGRNMMFNAFGKSLDQSRIKLVHLLLSCADPPNPHSNQAWPGSPPLMTFANEKYSWHILSQFYPHHNCFRREERKGEAVKVER